MSSPNNISLDQTQELVSLLQSQSVLKQELSKRVYDNKIVDTISAAKTGGSVPPVAKAGEKVPPLPLPSKSQSGDGLDDPGNLSLVAILGRMLVLLAQSNSTFYSIEWKEGTQMMQLSLQMAPVLKDATIQSAKLQSEQMLQEAGKEKTQGWFAVVGAVATLGAGVVGLNAASEGSGSGAVTGTDVNAAGAAGAAGAASAESALGEGLRTTASGETSALASAAGGAAKTTFLNLAKFLQKAMDAAMFGNIIQTIGNVPAGGFDSRSAALRAKQGEQDAIVKLGDMLSQYYNQGFNRTSEMTQSANQNFNSNVQTFESIIANVLSGVQKLYQG
ncbi:MAG: hypothetical protein KR126chlam2_00580 [Chlamydiae bacterium]|nr:hypothetical protein [Chlamydiota bacterium]